ncbi:hypothetical protein M0804_010624 [Polistes exclamans]|nr:hypothetical protein M0804_010624 [Polistes exclamans]
MNSVVQQFLSLPFGIHQQTRFMACRNRLIIHERDWKSCGSTPKRENPSLIGTDLCATRFCVPLMGMGP